MRPVTSAQLRRRAHRYDSPDDMHAYLADHDEKTEPVAAWKPTGWTDDRLTLAAEEHAADRQTGMFDEAPF